MRSSADDSDRAAPASPPVGHLEPRVPLGLSSLNILSGHPLVANTHKHFRLSKSDLLGADGSSFSALRSNFRTASPSVARACVTLPGFWSSPTAEAPRDSPSPVELGYTQQGQSQHNSDAQGDKGLLWGQGKSGRGALGPDPDPVWQHEHRGRQQAAADAAEQWIGEVALPKSSSRGR
ncbi:hypothetical protein WJX79_004415 [Trebouxia sp. C0005]